MKWHTLVVRCVPCAVAIVLALGLAACVHPDIAEALHEIVDALVVPDAEPRL